MGRGQKKPCPPKHISNRENLQTRRLLWSRRMPKLKEMGRKTLPFAVIFWQDGFPSASKQRNELPSRHGVRIF